MIYLLLVVLVALISALYFSAGVRRFVLKNLAYGYLLRFPVLTGLALLGIPLAAAFFARSLLGNLFDIYWGGGIFLLSLTAFMTAWAVMWTWHIIIVYGDARFNLSTFCEPYKTDLNVKWRHFLFFGLLGLVPVTYAVYYTMTHNWLDPGAPRAINLARSVVEALGGLFVSLFLLYVAALLHNRLSDPNLRCAPDEQGGEERAAVPENRAVPDMFIPTQGPLTRWGMEKAAQAAPPRTTEDSIERLRGRFGKHNWRGYFKYDANGNAQCLLLGHGVSAALIILSLLFYAVVGIYKFYRLGHDPYFPTLGYVLLLLMVLCFLLSDIAFFLDRFRIPVVLPLLVLLIVTSLMPWSDHYFAVAERAAPLPQATPTPTPLPTPAAPGPVVAASPQTPATQPARDGSIIVVAANGGGIQAAAWTAHVLTGLQRELGDDFGRMVRVVSSVSGGSVGAMYFVNEYADGRPPSGEELRRIVERVESSSLDEIAWGLVGPDAIRLLTSYGSDWDRGRALEHALLRVDLEERDDPAERWPGREGAVKSLSAWGVEAEAGLRPGSIFNTTISDTGQRLPLATVALPPDSEGQRVQKKFFDNLGGNDIQVVTAARLSASFPYVSPAARADYGGWLSTQAHVVDGGYYDNYGISSLVEWIDHEMDKGRIGRVLFVEIRGGPTPDDLPQQGGDTGEAAMGYEFESSRGWFYQAFAPLSTLLHVRDTGQFSHNRIEMRLLTDKWKGKVDIRDAVFEFEVKPDEDDPPLSWHLNQREKKRLRENWEREVSGDKKRKSVMVEIDRGKSGLEIVREFISRPAAPPVATPPCPPCPPAR